MINESLTFGLCWPFPPEFLAGGVRSPVSWIASIDLTKLLTGLLFWPFPRGERRSLLGEGLRG